MTSIWMGTVDMPHFDALQKDIKTDVLIIGGGMAGILCAYMLKEQGVDYTLVEGRRICSGITKNTTAKITVLHGLKYNHLLKKTGYERAKKYLDVNQKAVRKYQELCRNIDCDFEEKTAYVYSMDCRKKLEDETKALLRLGALAELSEPDKLPFQTAGAVGIKNQAQLHPLKFAAGIAKGLNIYENTFVKEFKDHTAVTENGRIDFQKAIFATHFPIDNKHGMYFMKLYQQRAYVIALANAADVNGMYIDEAIGGFSFRNYKNFLLIGGGSHRTGTQSEKWNKLREFSRQYYPDCDIKYTWAAQDCMSLDGIPYIGQYSKHMPHCFAATGFDKWGMTASMVSAMILADLATGQENSYSEVFSPSRSILKPQLFVNGWKAVSNLFIPSKKRCPHMGCTLKWNETEETWDCPCHGSRFDEKGNVIDNPANGNLKI